MDPQSAAIWIVVIAHLILQTDGLLCYCTEDECVSGERSNMCVQDNPTLGCYMQYYSKAQPAISMGCVRFALLCDSQNIRPEPYHSEWPIIVCCFSDHCNKNLTLPAKNKETHGQQPATLTARGTSAVMARSKTTPGLVSDSRVKIEVRNNSNHVEIEDNSQTESGVHPIFLLLIALVVIFLIVVVASLLVIVKIWYYRRKKPKPQKSWIIQQNMLSTKTQMSHLLTDHRSDSTMSELSACNNTSGFDVP